MISPLKKARLLPGVLIFILVIPFGLFFGVLHRLFGGTHPQKDKAY